MPHGARTAVPRMISTGGDPLSTAFARNRGGDNGATRNRAQPSRTSRAAAKRVGFYTFPSPIANVPPTFGGRVRVPPSADGSTRVRTLLSVPLFALLLIATNGAMLGGPADAPLVNVILAEFSLPSGRTVYLAVGDALLLAGVLCLWLEVLKATRTSVASIVDHALSLVVFVCWLVEFLIVERVGNATFLILMAMAFVDVVSGFTVTISSARRDLAIGGG